MARDFTANNPLNQINIVSQPRLHIGQPSSLTLFCMVKLAGLGQSQAFLYLDGGFGVFDIVWDIGATSSNHLFLGAANGSSFQTNLTGVATLTTGTWLAVGGVINNATSTAQLYLNGALDNSGAGNTSSNTGSAADGMSIGLVVNASQGAVQQMNGYIAECAIWNVALSA